MTADTPALAADQPESTVRPAKRKSGWWEEVKGLFWLIMAVLGFHSFIAKPFYIPSESMLPVLMKGDRLVVTKYPYGWSFISPTIPNPAAIFRGWCCASRRKAGACNCRSRMVACSAPCRSAAMW